MSKRTQRTQGKRIILPIGTKFHWLTVISEPFTKIEKNGRYVRYFKCRCKCGNIVEVSGSNLLRGNAKVVGVMPDNNPAYVTESMGCGNTGYIMNEWQC